MTTPPRVLSVSIVVPVLNEETTIIPTLVALRTAFPECEILVVDGGSDDRTITRAATVAPVVRSARGRARQMNTGAALTSGDVLWFIHADTRPSQDALDQLRRALDDQRVVAGGCSIRFDHDTRALRFLARTSTLRTRYLREIYGDQAMFVRRSAFDALGGFPDVALMEDLELSHRLRRRGRLVVVPATVTASARRFTAHGTVRMIVFMQYLKLLYALGVAPDAIRDRYRRGPRWPRLSRNGK